MASNRRRRQVSECPLHSRLVIRRLRWNKLVICTNSGAETIE